MSYIGYNSYFNGLYEAYYQMNGESWMIYLKLFLYKYAKCFIYVYKYL